MDLFGGAFLTLVGVFGELGTAIAVGRDAADQDLWVTVVGGSGSL